MKLFKRALSALLLFAFLLGLSSCTFVPTPISTFTECSVTLCPENGSSDTILSVVYGKTFSRPKDPTCDGKYFKDWYLEEDLTTPYDFSSPVVKDLTLYAGYTLDYVSLTNRIAEDGIPAAVTVNNTCSTAGFLSSNRITKSGSGILFHKTGTRYYLLTNQHVIEIPSEYTRQNLSIVDCYGNESSGVLIEEDESFDLAVMYFESELDLPVLSLAESNSENKTAIAALGQPNRQSNTLTYGEIEGYRSASVTGSSVTFDVLWHTAPIAKGSSGGALLDENLNIIAINYAVASTESGEFSHGLAIPIEQVRTFLAAHTTLLD